MAAKEATSSSDEFDYSDEEGAVRVEGIYIPPPPVPYCSVENKGPRLIITQITNDFFKSYAKKVILGPFHKSFNAIIGPNGSGKSNAIDAMLFVFGYRANKIRSRNLAVLLHNSSDYQDVHSCTVSVHFKEIIDVDDEHYQTVPNSEFVVSRTAQKDNTSYYAINNKKVKFNQVSALLMKHHIDLKHNRFLILQGEVEQISLMPPKGVNGESGMLEYLEDIIGTLRYREPLEQLSSKVDVYTQLKIEKINRLKIVQEEAEVLRKPMEDAVGFLKLENQISTKKNLVYQYNIFAIKDNAKEALEKQAEVDAQFDEINSKIADVRGEKSEAEKKLNEMNKVKSVMQKRRESTKSAYDTANKRHLAIAEEMQQINKNRHKMKDQLDAERRNVEKYNRDPEDIQKKIEECEVAIEKMQPKLTELQAEKRQHLETMKDATTDLQTKKDQLTGTLSVLRTKVSECQSSLSLAEHELKQYTSNADEQKSKLEQMQSSLKEVNAKIEQLSKESTKLVQLIPSQEKQLAAAQQELQTVKKQEADGITKYRSTRSKVEEFKSNMQASHSQSRVVDALMQQKREGNCPGIIGRLGDLGAIDLKYDVAISTACGALDNIVVDTVATGEWCINFMKANDIGRATIIMLEKMDHWKEVCSKKIVTPENVPRLFDLVRIPDKRIRPAFYFALRDTLVANDLEQATRVSYGGKRFRVVSLRGEVIESSGAMTGGGGRVLRGRMGQSVQKQIDPNEIVAMERDMQEQNNDLQQLRQRQTELETLIAQKAPELSQMKIAFEKIGVELQGLKKRQPGLVSSIATQKSKQIILDPNRMKKLETDFNGKKARYEAAEENANKVQTQVDNVTKEITDKTQGKTIVIDKKLNEINKNVDKLKTEINRLKSNIKSSERNAEKSSKKIDALEDDIKTAESRMIVMKEQRDEIETDAAKLLEVIEEMTVQLHGELEFFDEVRASIKDLTSTELGLKSQLIEIEQARQAVQDEINEVNVKIKGLQTKMANLKYQEVPDETMEEFKQYSNDELNDVDMEATMKQLQGLEIQLKALQPNIGVIADYRNKMKLVNSRSKELDEVNGKWQQMRDHYDHLRGRRKDEFLSGFKIIKGKLKEMYQMITIGGDADFELIDSYDPFSEGIQFRVRPPKKTWKVISNLSGGEKTLSSLALVFALHYYKPSPLYVMDEIDAALDFKNVSIIGNYIKERTKNAQFIIISLRPNMFELACHLIGVYKTDDCSKSVTIDPRPQEEEKIPEDMQNPPEQPNAASDDLFPSPDSNPLSVNVVEQADSQGKSSEDMFPSQGNANASIEVQPPQELHDSFSSGEVMPPTPPGNENNKSDDDNSSSNSS